MRATLMWAEQSSIGSEAGAQNAQDDGVFSRPGSTAEKSMLAPAARGRHLLDVEVLRGIDARSTLLVVSCSATKARGGLPASLAEVVANASEPLLTARDRVLAAADTDLSAVMPAWRRYQGRFYKSAADTLADAAANSNLVILSGGYGLVGAEELIGWYDKQLDVADWPAGLLESALIGEARRIGTQTVVAFAAASSSYARLLRRVPWQQNAMSARLVTVAGIRGGAMSEVPRRLGAAFSVFWYADSGAYPPGVVVEKL